MPDLVPLGPPVVDEHQQHRTRRARVSARFGIVTKTGPGVPNRVGCRHGSALLPQHAIWLYLRFTLSYRDVEELLAARGLDISYETVRRWVLKFGPAIARRLRQRRPRPSDR